MPTPKDPQSTAFSHDVQGRYICNGLDEALNSTTQPLPGQPLQLGARDFNIIIVGGGTFGAVVAQHLFIGDATHSHRILVLEAGPFTLPEHVQNMPMIGEPPEWGLPWNTSVAGFRGLLFTLGGRSLTWGGWSPQLLDAEMPLSLWPSNVVSELNNSYFRQASDQIGVSETNDFIFGPLHIALRDQLYQGIKSLPATSAVMKFVALPDAAPVRFSTPQPTDDDLKNWLGIPGSTLNRQELLDIFKLEAPLAVQSQTEPGQFPINKFSAIPLLIKAARAASDESDVSAGSDVRKRMMVVPNCHVRRLCTANEGGNVRVTALQTAVDANDLSKDIYVSVSPNTVVIVALGTIETTRLTLLSFGKDPTPCSQGAISSGILDRIGKNLMAHLRSNLTIRIPRDAVKSLPKSLMALQTSALFVKGQKDINGITRHFHFQITATGAGFRNTDAEAELFKKIPDLDNLNVLQQSNDSYIVITIRGIGEMSPMNPDSNVTLDLNPSQTDFTVRKAYVNIGDARTTPTSSPASQQTKDDHDLWNVMDETTDELATIFAGNLEYEILLPPQGAVTEIIKVPQGTPSSALKTLVLYDRRRDGLGTTHHETGTLRMGNLSDAVTDEFGRIHETLNAYVVGPALFPTIGSPNPMLTGVALARRTGDHLVQSLPHFVAPTVEPNFEYLFDGTEKTFKRWQKIGSNGFALIDGAIVTYGNSDFALLYYAPGKDDRFENFTLRLQFSLSNQRDQFGGLTDNSGIFVRFRHPLLLPTPEILARDKFNNIPGNKAWVAVYSGFEVQIDERALGDTRINEGNGLDKNRTGAIYKIPTGQNGEPQLQIFQPGPTLQPDVWYDYEIAVSNNVYRVTLAGIVTTTFNNPDTTRAISPNADLTYGCIGRQSYFGSRVSFRNIRIQKS